MSNVYIPSYVNNHEFGFANYVKTKPVITNTSNLPSIAGVDWSPLAEIFYNPRLSTLESIFDFCVKNIRPILVVIEGPSGEAKTSLTISLLGWALWRYSRTKLTKKNFKKYFLLGKFVALRPDIVAKEYKERQFFTVDEAHLALDSMQANSRQNKDANDFADTIRQKQIFAFFITIFSGLIDKRLVNYKVMMRIIVKYNSQKFKRIFFDVQLNVKYIDAKGTQHWDYFPLEKNRMAKWCPEDLWDISKTLKDDNVFGGTTGTLMKYDDIIKRADDNIIMDTETDLKAGIFANWHTPKDWVRAFYKAGWNEFNTQAAIRNHQEQIGEKKLSAKKYKELLLQVKDELSMEKRE